MFVFPLAAGGKVLKRSFRSHIRAMLVFGVVSPYLTHTHTPVRAHTHTHTHTQSLALALKRPSVSPPHFYSSQMKTRFHLCTSLQFQIEPPAVKPKSQHELTCQWGQPPQCGPNHPSTHTHASPMQICPFPPRAGELTSSSLCH